MTRYFAAADFETARTQLQEALERCASGCSASLRARLHRDLGVVLMTGFGDAGAGEKELTEAVAADPKVTLDPAYTTPEIEAVFQRVAPERPKKKEKTRGDQRKRKRPESDVDHEPVSEQRVGTPIPVYAELAAEAEGPSGRLHFRRSSAEEWQTVRMARVGDGWGAEIPCRAVRQAGGVRYYLEFKDEDGEGVGSAGSRDEPFDVEIVSEEVDDPPHFPDRAAPRRCSDARGCAADSDCGAGESCQAGSCARTGPSHAWLSFGLAQDAALVSGSDVCTKQSQLEKGFACFRQRGSQYHGTPRAGVGDQIGAGFVVATTRAYLASDISVSDALTLGMRVGYALRGGGPQPDGGKRFFPMHAELRAQYWLGGAAFEPEFGAFLLASGGVAQVDAKKSVRVGEDRSVAPPPNQIDNPDVQDLDAYKKMGLSFAAVGMGAYLPFAAHGGLVGDLKAMLLFPDTGANVELELGYALGL